MAHYFIFPEKDTTLYSHPDRSTMNAGHDEILEIVKEPGNGDQYNHPTRVLIQFKSEDIKEAHELIGSEIFNSTSITTTASVSTHNINVYAVSQSWTEGTGKYLNLPTGSNGCSWEFRDNSSTASPWTGSGTDTNWFGDNVWGTGSIDSTVLTQGGGTWYTGSEFSSNQQFLEGDSLDTNFEVKNIIQKYSHSIYNASEIPTGIFNYGFLLKMPDSVEAEASSSFGEIQYFSSNTHTIYPPKLIFKWNDSTQLGEHQSLAKSGSLLLSLYNNKKEYNQNDEAIFRIHVRDKYPDRTFSNTSNYLNIGYLATSSFYSIRDAHTEREIIPFDEYTKLSSDEQGMFLKIYMKGLQPERYYRLLFKNTHNDGTEIYDNDYYFKVVR
jgi:hypothetical protein